MKYNVYRQGPDERSIPSNVPLIDDPWKLMGSIEDERDESHVNWNEAVFKVTGKSIRREYDRGTFYKVLPAE